MNICRIIIIQTTLGGTVIIKSELKRKGFIFGTDLRLVHSMESVESLIVPGENQLFITGLIDSDRPRTVAFVEKIRALNPKLVTISFSTMNLFGPFDRVVERMNFGSYEQLVQVIQEFQSGALQRQVPA